MSAILFLAVAGVIIYCIVQAIIGIVAFLALVFFVILMAPLVIGSSQSGAAAFFGLCAMCILIWFLTAVFNPSNPKYTKGKRSSNPFD